MELSTAIRNLKEQARTNMFDRNTDAESVRTVLSHIDYLENYVERLETRLMFALSPTNHELSKNTIDNFKCIIRKYLDTDTYTIKEELKKYWSGVK